MSFPGGPESEPAPELGSGKFAPTSWSQVADLVRAAPLAWVVSAGAVLATPLPLRPKLDPEGRITRLDGHFARGNPQLAALRADPMALILFMGPQGYISPSWMADRTQAPTWTYASAQFVAELELFEEPARVEASLRDLIDGMEAGRPNAWALEEMGARYGRLATGVVGFEARVVEVRTTFKLGQDERDDVLPDILAGLRVAGRTDLADWISTSNSGRVVTETPVAAT